MAPRKNNVFDKSLSDIAREFNFRGRIKYLDLPRPLHDGYIHLYRRILDAAEKLQCVLLDGEHALVLAEGRSNFTLPPDDFFDDCLSRAKGSMRNFDPFHVERATAEHIRISAPQMERFMEVFTAGYDLSHMVLTALKTTDYIACLRHMRERGVPYAGPTSVREFSALFLMYDSVHRSHETFMADMRLRYGLEKQRRDFM